MVFRRRPSVPVRWVFVLLAAVFVLKLVVLLELRDHPMTQPNAGLDTTAYVDLAKKVLDGDWGLGPGVYYVSPLYIYFLAGALAALKSFTAVRVLQIVLGTASVGFIFFTTRAWFGERAAWIAAILAALTGLFTFYEVLILQAAIDAFLTSAALYFLSRGLLPPEKDLPPKGGSYRSGKKIPTTSASSARVASAPSPTPVASAPSSTPVASAFRRKDLLFAGLIFGIQTLNRPNVMLAAAGVAVVMAIATPRRGSGQARRVRPAAVLVAGLLLGMAPAAARNVVVAHQWSFVSSHGGLNFYIGNREDATGFYMPVPGITPTITGQEKDARRVAERALGHSVNDAEASDYFFGLSRTWMANDPGGAAALFARKFYYTFNAAHLPLPHSYPFYAYDERTALRVYFVGPWLLVPLGLVGLVLRRPRRAEYLVWVSFVPAYAAAVALFFVAERYRLPLLVPLCAGAGATVDAAISAVRLRQWRSLVVLAGAVAILSVAANWRLNVEEGRWLEGLRTAQQLVILERYDEAAQWARRLDGVGSEVRVRPPRPGAGSYGVGSQLLASNQPARALPYLEAAHQADPEYPAVEFTLGQALLKAGRATEAVPHLRKGFEAGIELPWGGYDLPAALKATGDYPAAVAAIQRITPAGTDEAEAWLRLGRLAMEVRAPEVAEPYFRHAVQMEPGVSAVRQQLGLNLLVQGRLEEAARELGDASRLNPRDADSLSHLAYCEYKLGRAADARAHALAALAINPEDQLAKGIIRAGGS
jgi:tetratricopeptide (TPR) repeat protein